MKADDFVYPQPEQNFGSDAGLTVRDYIAIEAMKAIISTLNVVVFMVDKEQIVAEAAYLYADAMIAQSEVKE